MRRSRVTLLLALLLGPAGCREPPAGKAEPPAALQNPVTESALTTVLLTPEAERRLGIETAVVERRPVPRTRTVGGEVMAPPGARVVIAAPRAGVIAGLGGPGFGTGARVREGDAVLRLVPLPAESDLFGAREALAAAQARAENARVRSERAQELFRQDAGSREAMLDAEAERQAAEAELAAARARVALVEGGRVDTTLAPPIMVPAPVSGVVRDVAAAVGQLVTAGTRLVELDAVDPLWVRVPVYAGDLATLAPERGAQVQDVGDPPGSPGRPARRIVGPPSADPAAATVDLYFAVANRDGRLRSGQRVGVTVQLRDESVGLVVPWSAVVRDIEGGAWVYERTGERAFTRRRVELVQVVGDVAVLSRGPAPGAIVVRVGAAELFSTEFGPAK